MPRQKLRLLRSPDEQRAFAAELGTKAGRRARKANPFVKHSRARETCRAKQSWRQADGNPRSDDGELEDKQLEDTRTALEATKKPPLWSRIARPAARVLCRKLRETSQELAPVPSQKKVRFFFWRSHQLVTPCKLSNVNRLARRAASVIAACA